MFVGDVLDMGYHRNGVGGEGFWTIIFRGHEHCDCAGELFVATYFENDENAIRTAVLRVRAIEAGDAQTALRGDRFHDELKTLVENYVWPHEVNDKVDRRAAIAHTRKKSSPKVSGE